MLDQHFLVDLSEGVIVVGGAIAMIGAGIWRVYKTARNVEMILEHNVKEERAREELAANLKEHIDMEDARDRIRDTQFAELTLNVRDIAREVRPNGGSSMKDVLNHTSDMVKDTQTRVAVLEEWKRLQSK